LGLTPFLTYDDYNLDRVKNFISAIKAKVTELRLVEDPDGDFIGKWKDNCPNTYNPDQKHSYNDWIGDACLPPPAPQLISPANNSQAVNPNNIELRRQPSVDPNGDPVTYCVTIKEEATPTDIPVYSGCDQGQSLSDTFFVNSLMPGKTYWWAVWAKDSNGN
jgi:hypothetical protein